VETSAAPPAAELHRIAEEVEAQVARSDHGSVCVHVDPVDRDHPAYARVLAAVSEVVAAERALHSFHDLRLVGDAETFTAVLDVKCEPGCRDSTSLQRRITDAIRVHYPRASVVVEVEPTYSY
jgi:divalent metal cation (Fe/Co/Zn/Cd) transporter